METMALNREDIIKQIEDNRKYYAGHAECDIPCGKDYSQGAANALAELLVQIEKYDEFISLDEISAELAKHLHEFPTLTNEEAEKYFKNPDKFWKDKNM
jgi:pantoate kinase